MEIFVPLAISTGLQLLTGLFSRTKTQEQPAPNLKIPRSDYGSPIVIPYGKVRLDTNRIFPKTKEQLYRVEENTTTQSRKGGGQTQVTSRSVYGTWASLICQGPVTLDRIIINGNQIEKGHNFFQSHCSFFDGTQTQVWGEIQNKADPPNNQIEYRDLAYIGFSDVWLEPYGNTVPVQISAIIVDAKFGAQPNVRDVVKDICLRAGIPEMKIDVSELDMILRDGISVVQSGEGYRKILEELFQFYLFTAIEDSTGKIVFKKFDRGAETPIVIPTQHFIPVSGEGIENKLFTKTTTPLQDLPQSISFKYFNENQSYNQDVVVEYFEEFTKENSLNISSGLTSYPYEVKERVRNLLRHLYVQQRNNYTFTIFGNYINQLSLLSLLQLPNNEIVQIQQLNFGNDYQLEIVAKYYSGSIAYSYTPTEPPNSGITPSLNDPTGDIPDIYLLDIPLIGDYPPNTLLLFATRSADLNISYDAQTSYTQVITHRSASTIGDLLTPLPNVEGLNPSGSFDIALDSGLVESITDEQFNTGFNLALIGRIDSDGFHSGKLIRFRDVEALGGNQYRLSYLHQGDYFTSQYDTSTLPLKFFLLRAPNYAYYSTVEVVPNTPIDILPVTSQWQDIGSSPVLSVTPTGNAYRPNPVDNANGEMDRDGNLKISWTYNGVQSSYATGTDNLNTTFEVDILNASSVVVRTLSSQTTSVIYRISEQVTDGTTSPFNVRIYALGANGSRGEGIEALLSPTPDPSIVFGTTDIGFQGTRYITAADTVTEADNRRVLICINPDPTFLDLTFPDDLSNGFECIVINDKSSNISARVRFLVTNLLNPDDNVDMLRGSTCIVNHSGLGTYAVIANNRKFLQVNDINQAAGKVWNFRQKLGNDSIILEADDTTPDNVNIEFSIDDNYILGLVGNTYMEKSVYDANDNQKVDIAENSELADLATRATDSDNSDLLENNNSAYHLNRNNHTGTQPASTISDFSEQVNEEIRQDIVTVTAARSLLASDYRQRLECSGTFSITLPLNLDNSFECVIVNRGTGTITLVTTGTLESIGDKLETQFTAAHLYYRGSSSWSVVGALT